MKQRLIISLVMLIGITLSAMSQNKIDNLVNRYSSNTTSKFTSAVERNPKTHAIAKVVKVLELNYTNIQPFIDAFEQEANNNDDFSKRRDDNDLIIVLTSRESLHNRIYMLKAYNYYGANGYRNNRTNSNIIIIVKYK